MRLVQIAILGLSLVLSGCSRKQPSFDEQYEKTRENLEASSSMIDLDITASGNPSNAVEAASNNGQ